MIGHCSVGGYNKFDGNKCIRPAMFCYKRPTSHHYSRRMNHWLLDLHRSYKAFIAWLRGLWYNGNDSNESMPVVLNDLDYTLLQSHNGTDTLNIECKYAL